jgi:glucokinase
MAKPPIVSIAFKKRPGSEDPATILAGDTGGTKTNMALYRSDANGLTELKEKKYASKDYHSLTDIIKDFCGTDKPDRICAAIAGPVIHGKSTLTNLSWQLDSETMSRDLKTPVRFINDLEATAYGLSGLQKEELSTLSEGHGVPPGNTVAEGNLAIIAPGTGLGEAGLFWDGSCYHPFATEGGHSDFGPRGEEDIALYRYLQQQFGHVSWERVVSGMGIKSIYHFLTEVRKETMPAWLAERMQQEDPAAVISEAALKREDPVCREAMELFSRFLATEAASLVLKLKATGGLFIGGGIPPKILSLLQEGEWLKNFVSDGRMQQLLEEVPVYVVLNDKMALMGAAHYGSYNM